jgi:hypothetical protein
MVTVLLVLVLAAFVAAIMWAAGKWPGWVSVLLLCFIALLEHLPLGR